MTSENFFEHATDTTPVAPDLSVSAVFHDAYDRTAATLAAIPTDIKIGAIGATTGAAIALYLSRGEALPGSFDSAEKDMTESTLAHIDAGAIMRGSSFSTAPPRLLLTDIRTTEGVTIRAVDGQSRIVLGDLRSIKPVLLTKTAGTATESSKILEALGSMGK